MNKRTKWIFYFLLSLPLVWLAYNLYIDNLGAQPAETLNKRLGKYTLYLLLANLYWGCMSALIPSPASFRKLLMKLNPLRRPLGVATFFYALLHFVSYFLREGDFTVAFKQIVEKKYLIFGYMALLLLLLLAITSNNFSVRKLKAKKWKVLHRFVFVAFFLVTVHVLLIEKRSWLANKYTLFPMLAVLSYRFCHWVLLEIRAHRMLV
jgi:methionine sulfoxide reductase heme-binding subunit